MQVAAGREAGGPLVADDVAKVHGLSDRHHLARQVPVLRGKPLGVGDHDADRVVTVFRVRPAAAAAAFAVSAEVAGESGLLIGPPQPAMRAMSSPV